MHTADPNSPLGYWCRKVDAMEPGQCLEVSRHALSDIPSFEHNFATFTPADRILGNIVGSAFTHSYRVRLDNGNVVFERHSETGELFYESPDDDYRRRMLAERRLARERARTAPTLADGTSGPSRPKTPASDHM